MTKVIYRNFEIDTSALPESSVNALLRRGLAHVLGNEQHAKVGPNSAWYKDLVKAKTAEGGEAYVPTDDEIEEAKAAFQAKAIEALTAGTLGTSIRGPSAPPLETEMNRIARTTVINRLKAAGLKPPKGEDVVEFANGTKKTMAQMIATVLERDGEVITKEANKAIADAKRKAEQAKKVAAEAGSKNAEDLGL